MDALTGPAIGRPRRHLYRTADLVGLDTMDHVIRGSALALRQDPWRRYFTVPDWLERAARKRRAGPENQGRHLCRQRQQVWTRLPATIGTPAPQRTRRYEHSSRSRIPPKIRRVACQRASRRCNSWVGDPPRRVSPCRSVTGGDRRYRSRRGFCHPLGFRLEHGAVRDLAGGPAGADGGLDRGGHRRRQGHDRDAAAGLGQADGRRASARGSYSAAGDA